MAVSAGTVTATLKLNDQFSGAMTRAGAQMQQSGAKMQAAGQKMSATGASLTRSVTLPLGLAAVAATKLATDFDTSLTKIETLVGVNRTKVAEWRDDILKLSTVAGRGPKELADAMFIVTSAGQRGANALDILQRSAKASAAGLGDTAVIARTVTSAIQAYGPANLSASRATDILVATVREGNLEASALAGSLGRVIGIASQVGVSFEQVGGFIATFTRLGVSAEESTTALRATLNAAIKPTQGAEEAMLALGTSADQLRRTIREDGLDAALRDLVERAEGNTTAIAAVIPNIRALSGVLGTAGAQGKEFSRINASIANSMGILDEAFKRTTETRGFKFNQFMAKLQQVGIQLGDALAPAFLKLLASGTSLIEMLVKGLDIFTALPVPLQQLGLVLGAAAIAAGPLLLVVGNLILVFGTIMGSFGGVAIGAGAYTAATTTATVATTGFNMAMLTTPVTLAGVQAALISTATAMDVAVVGAFASMKAAATAAYAVIAAHPFVLVGAAIAVLAGIIVSFVSREGGMIEEWYADGANTIATYRGEWEKLGTTVEQRNASLDVLQGATQRLNAAVEAGVEGALEAKRVMSEQIALGEPAEIALAKVSAALRDGGAAQDVMRDALIAGSTAANAAARAATELAAARDVENAAADRAAAAEARLAEALSNLGVVTKADALAGIEDLSVAFASGQVPVDQMITLIDEAGVSLKEMGLRNIPEVEAALRKLNATYTNTNGILQTAMDKQDRLSKMVQTIPPFIDDVGESATDAASDMDLMIESMDLDKVVPPIRLASEAMADLGIKIPDIAKEMASLTRVVESGGAPVRQMVEAIRKQRDEYEKLGVLTPELSSQLTELERVSLQNATAADRAALGFKGLFDGFVTGNEKIDGFLGKFGGIFDTVTGVLGQLGGPVGNFFTGLTDKIGGVFGQSGAQFGGNFLSGITGSLGGLGGLFGGKGKDSTDSFVQSVSSGVGAVAPIFTTSGTASAAGFGSGIMQTMGGGGGFDIGSMFNTSGQAAGSGFTLGLSTVPGETGSIFASAANQGGGGFLSGLSGLLGGGGGGGGGGGIGGIFQSILGGGGGGGGGGEGGGFLSGLFSGAGGGAGGNFLGGMTSGLANGMSAAKSGLQGVFQAGLSLIPVVGPILSQFAGPLFKGLGAIAGKIKGIFGVSAAEKEAREIGSSLDSAFDGMLSGAQKAAAAAAAAGTESDRWALNTIAVRDAYLAVGKSQAEADAAVRSLSEAAKATPEAAQATVDSIKAVTDKVSEAMSTTGLDLETLRNQAINDAASMGITVEEAFTKLATVVPEAVAGAAASQCESQTTAAACGVASAAQVTTAVVEGAAAQTVAVTESAAAQVAAVTGVVEGTVAATESAAEVIEEKYGSISEIIKEMSADTTKTLSEQYQSAVSDVKMATSDLAATMGTSAEEMAAAHLDRSQAILLHWSTALEGVEAKATLATANISATMGTSFQSIEMSVSGVADAASSSFGSMAESFRESMGDVLEAAEDMKGEMVDNSIIPDMVMAANSEILTIGDAAKQAAEDAQAAFRSTSMSASVGVQVRESVKQQGAAVIAETGSGGTFAAFDRRSSAEELGGGQRLMARTDSRSDDDRAVQLVVDGQVLAEATIRNMPRALANKGLAYS